VKFSDTVDRAIVDSATFESPEAGLARMAALLDSGLAISDLAWSRLTPWRELTAQFFDAPALVAHLSKITRVVVNYEPPAGERADRSQALLLIGWLAARLGWRAAGPPSKQAGSTTLHLSDTSGSPIAVELRPAAPSEDVLDRLSALMIECRGARFTIARDDAPDCAVARSEVAGMQAIQRKVRLERLDEAGLIGEELRLLGKDETYERALKIAAALVPYSVCHND
jgi:glucose-6-phosphate dehydrogenase assembly protein OpcA